MGITDNLFQRKSQGRVKTTPRVASGSQQYRLSNAAYDKIYNNDRNAGSPREKDEKALKKGEFVTRFFEQDGNLVGSSISSSLPDLSLSMIYERNLSYPKCVCYRSACYIACDEFSCHFTGIGRVRTRCPCHPTSTTNITFSSIDCKHLKCKLGLSRGLGPGHAILSRTELDFCSDRLLSSGPTRISYFT